MKLRVFLLAVLALFLTAGAWADTYLITVNATLCVDTSPHTDCQETLSGNFDYVASGVVGPSGPASSINLSLSGPYATTFTSFESGNQYAPPNGTGIYFTNASGDQLLISLDKFLPNTSGPLDEDTTVGCGAGNTSCLSAITSAGLINFGGNAGGTFTATLVQNPPPRTPEPASLFLVGSGLLIGAIRKRMR